MFISSAFAQTAPAAAGGDMQSTLMNMLPILVMFGVLYLVMIRPQGLAPVKSKAGHEGLVVDSRYLGDVIQLQVLFSDFDEPFVIRMPAGSAPAKGQTQRFAALANHVLVFPAEG